MFDYISGKLISKTPAKLTIEAGGFGYTVHIPLSTFNVLGKLGDTVTLLLSPHIREDAWMLYGFAAEEERALFNLLITISGVGPKSAIAALSGMSVSQIRAAIASGDVDKLTVIPGIGKKIAQRVVVELKDKIKTLPGESTELLSIGEEAREAVLALETLGFNRMQAEKAVGKAMKSGDSLPVEEIIRKALAFINK